MVEIPELDVLCGRKWRWQYEESYVAEHGSTTKTAARRDRWLMVVPFTGGRGHVYCHGRERIEVSLDVKKGYRIRSLLTLPGVVVEQDGNDGLNFSLPVDHVDAVCRLMAAYRRRNLSDKRRKQLAIQLERIRYPSKKAVSASQNVRKRSSRCSDPSGVRGR